MVKIFDVNQSELVAEVASGLKKEGKVKMPDWAQFVKTGNHRERAPIDLDWWYKRAASILRRVYIFGPLGVSKLRTKYGGKKNRGVKPGKFVRAGGKVIRVIFQQLEKAGYIRKETKGIHKGRIITSAGMSLLDKAAGNIFKKKPVEKKKEEAKESAEKKKEEADIPVEA